MDRGSVAGQIAEVRAVFTRGLRHVAKEELAGSDRQFERVTDAGQLVRVEQAEAGEGCRDRVGTRARIEEHTRLNVEVIAPARLRIGRAAQAGKRGDAVAELALCLFAVHEPVARI